MKVFLNGKLVEKENALISIFDHGLLYGDGVFEGIREYNYKIFKLDQHLKRFYRSAQAIDLKINLTPHQLTKAIIETLKVNKLKDAYIRLVATRGIGDLGLDPRKCSNPTIFIIADKVTLYPEKFYKKGLQIITVPTRRNIPEAINPNIKSLNYLNNILAKIEANLRNVHEAIMLSNDGYVAECTGDNIFIFYNNKLITPPPYIGALEGITRNTVIQIAKEKLKLEVQENLFNRYELYNADECFLTGTAAEVVAVVKIDGRTIGKGVPGRITLKIMREFKKLVQSEGIEVK